MPLVFAPRTLLTALLIAAPLAHAAPQGMPGGEPMNRPPMMQAGMAPMPFMGRVALSEAQQDKLFDIHYRQMPALRSQEKAGRDAREALRALAGSDDYTPAKARELARSAATAQTELMLIRAQMEHDSLAVLTAAQRKQLAEAPRNDDRARGPGPRGDAPPAPSDESKPGERR